jgi:hypothetical protein
VEIEANTSTNGCNLGRVRDSSRDQVDCPQYAVALDSRKVDAVPVRCSCRQVRQSHSSSNRTQPYRDWTTEQLATVSAGQFMGRGVRGDEELDSTLSMPKKAGITGFNPLRKRSCCRPREVLIRAIKGPVGLLKAAIQRIAPTRSQTTHSNRHDCHDPHYRPKPARSPRPISPVGFPTSFQNAPEEHGNAGDWKESPTRPCAEHRWNGAYLSAPRRS